MKKIKMFKKNLDVAIAQRNHMINNEGWNLLSSDVGIIILEKKNRSLVGTILSNIIYVFLFLIFFVYGGIIGFIISLLLIIVNEILLSKNKMQAVIEYNI